MVEHDGQASQPAWRSQANRQSIQPNITRPLYPAGYTSHRRSASDNVSVSTQSQAASSLRLSRGDSLISAKSQPCEPVTEATAPGSPPMPSPAAWSEGGDLGSRSPVDAVSPNAGFEPNSQAQPRSKLPISRFSLPASTPASRPRPRPRPTPFQFEDTAYHGSPAPSSRSMFSPPGRFRHSPTDSHTNLLDTPSTSSWWRSPRTPPAYSTVFRDRRRWCHWRPAWIMYAMFVFGLLFAVGHHAFYKVLDDRPADNQLAMLRYGQILAFASKACLMSAVIVAYRQRVWATVRSKMLSVGALDSLFAATEDLSALWNLEIYKRAKVAITLAIMVWLAPLVIIFTSNTLSVEMALTVDNSTCPGVRSLNFVKEELENWRNATKIDNLFGLSVSLWNSTTIKDTDEGWFDYYTSHSDQFEQIARLAAYGKQVVGRKEAAMDICGPGWNCTYMVSFTAPGYNCQEVAEGVGSKVGRLRNHEPPRGFDTSLLLPEGNYSYYAYTSGGDYAVAQMKEVGIGGMPKEGPPFPKNLGAFRTEPILWIGYVERVDPDHIPSRSEPGWDEAFVPKVFACENYETEYTVRFNHTGGQQITEIINRNFLYPVLNTQFLQDEMAEDGTNDNTTAYPESNYVYPNDDKHHYRRVAAFHSIGAMVRSFVNGTVKSELINSPIAETKALQTKLLDRRHEWFPYRDLMARVRSFGEDVVLSILSDPQFLAVVWAARPDEISGDRAGDRAGGGDYYYPCERSRFENRYRYHAGTLWAVYGVAVLLAALGVRSGARAVLENEGRLRDTRFSSIVAATRGPALEKVGWGNGGGDPVGADLPPDVKNLKVGYGIVHGGGGGGAASTTTMSPPLVSSNNNNSNNNNALGLSHGAAATNTPASTPGYHNDDGGHLFPERELWDARDVRYGFGLEGDVSQLRQRGEGSMFRGRTRG